MKRQILAGTVLAGALASLAVALPAHATPPPPGGASVTAPLVLQDTSANAEASFIGIAAVGSAFGGSGTTLPDAQRDGQTVTMPGLGHSGTISRAGECLTAVGSAVEFADCDGRTSQTWEIRPDGHVESSRGDSLALERSVAGAETGLPGATVNRLVTRSTSSFVVPGAYAHDNAFTASATHDTSGWVVVSGTGTPGATVSVASVAGLGAGTATVDATGAWSVTLPGAVEGFPLSAAETAAGVRVAELEITL